MSNTTNVKNNHAGSLNVAGIDIAAGAEAAVDSKKLKMWLNGNAAKIWVEQELIEIAGADSEDDAPSEKDQLLERARELGLNPAGNTGVKKLKAMIEEAENDSEEEGSGEETSEERNE